MTSLVERLREEALALQQTAWSRMDGGQKCSLNANLAEEAADEIERLTRELSEAHARLGDLIGHARFVDVNFGISYAHLHEAEAVFMASAHEEAGHE